MPFPLGVAVPLAGWAVTVTLARSRLPSGSVSLAATLTTTEPFCGDVPVSTVATGGSATAVTVTVPVAVAQRLVVSQIR